MGLWTNAGKADFALHGVSGTDLRVLLINNTNHTFDVDRDFVTQVTAWEASGAGYVRKSISGASTVEDDALNVARVVATALTNYTSASFGTVIGGYIYRHITNDANHILWMWLPLVPAVVTNGGTLTLSWNANGLAVVS